ARGAVPAVGAERPATRTRWRVLAAHGLLDMRRIDATGNALQGDIETRYRLASLTGAGPAADPRTRPDEMTGRNPPDSGRWRWLGTVVVGVVVPTAFFALLEIVTRAYAPTPNVRFFSEASCTHRDPLVGYSFLPNCVGRWGKAGVRVR